ncbi:glycine zipper 2TM domain-containing protein [Sphaerotilus microaerophilus]|nr:glycine zipper 2TM domain-containing protein [Sphaerotilus sp. FB-5]
MPAAASATTAHTSVVPLQPVPATTSATAAMGHPPPPAASRAPRLPQGWLVAAGAGLLVVGAASAWWMLGRSSLDITAVRGAQPVLVGNGQAQPLRLSYSARNSQIRRVDVRFLRGEGHWSPTAWSVPVDTGGSSAHNGEVSAGTIQQVVSAPTQATFEYTLVDADGRRSAPFEQTFSLLPPVTLGALRWSQPPRLGQPLSVQLSWRKGAGDIVQVRQRVVESTQPWPEGEQTVAVQLNAANGHLNLPLQAPSQPLRATLEYELVDSLGVHSAPQQLALNLNGGPITSGPATVVGLQQLASAARDVPVGSVAGALIGAGIGNQFGRGRGRAAATVAGGVAGAFAGNAIQQRITGPGPWQTTVRFDDGNTRRLTHGDAPRWAVGQRVVVSAAGAIQLH